MMLELRPQVAEFAQEMERKLRENDYKGGWDVCSMTYLVRRLSEEVAELKDALINPAQEFPDIIGEAADVANFAMMVADMYGEHK
jgi:NTP pyrophosphatase (non-canonical NTP hydrolase)